MRTVHDAFRATVAAHADRPFMQVLPETAAIYGIPAGEITYTVAANAIDGLTARYRGAGYRRGHRIGLRLENRPSMLLHFFALNALGVSIVPINPDLRAAELDYLVTHSGMALAVDAAIGRAGLPHVPVIGPDDTPPPAPEPAGSVGDEAALLYTSGTTGLPKGCVLSNAYFHTAGSWYVGMGGYCALHRGQDRMLTPLPLFHMNALAASTMAMMTTGGCLIVLDRFHPTSWWDSVAKSHATIVHYLGVMPAILMAGPPTPGERAHRVRFGFGAGVDRRLHALAEERFGFPLIEGWAMTETGCSVGINANVEPRNIGQSCFGRPGPHVAWRIVADDGRDAAIDAPGELLVRHAGPDPRAGFFTEYLKDPAATQTAWADGWFHTGDVVRRDAAGLFYFVDRKKNVIRRSGENIAAVEVEGVLQRHPLIRIAGVASVPDDIRGEEVFALLVPHAPIADPAAAAREITGWALTQLAYYKPPGYIAFVETIPVTATNKIQRANLRQIAQDLHEAGAAIDTRALKRRT